MLPVMEDNGLAKRWRKAPSHSTRFWRTPLCALRNRHRALPGDVTEDQIARMIGDVSWLAYRWNKPLAARLMPAPGKRPGEVTEFGGERL